MRNVKSSWALLAAACVLATAACGSSDESPAGGTGGTSSGSGGSTTGSGGSTTGSGGSTTGSGGSDEGDAGETGGSGRRDGGRRDGGGRDGGGRAKRIGSGCETEEECSAVGLTCDMTAAERSLHQGLLHRYGLRQRRGLDGERLRARPLLPRLRPDTEEPCSRDGYQCMTEGATNYCTAPAGDGGSTADDGGDTTTDASAD